MPLKVSSNNHLNWANCLFWTVSKHPQRHSSVNLSITKLTPLANHTVVGTVTPNCQHTRETKICLFKGFVDPGSAAFDVYFVGAGSVKIY